MKNKTLIAAAVIALGVLIAAPFAFAQRGGMHSRGNDFGTVMMLGHLQRAKQALGLSDDQVAQVQTIFSDLRTQNQPYRESLRSGFQSVLQTLINNPNDTAAAQALIDQQTASERAMKVNALNAASKALNVLTPDQRAKLSTFVQERAGSNRIR